MYLTTFAAGRRCPGVAFDLVVAVVAVVVDSVSAADGASVERSGTEGSSVARKNLSMMSAPPPERVKSFIQDPRVKYAA